LEFVPERVLVDERLFALLLDLLLSCIDDFLQRLDLARRFLKRINALFQGFLFSEVLFRGRFALSVHEDGLLSEQLGNLVCVGFLGALNGAASAFQTLDLLLDFLCLLVVPGRYA